MKANELMINDWVAIDEPDKYAGAIGQILSLFFHKEDEGAYFNVFIQGTYGFLIREICNIDLRPIPLTIEILEKNGWVCEECDGTYFLEIEIPMAGDGIECQNVRYFPKTNLFVINTCLGTTKVVLKYVHKLQHVLRDVEFHKEIVL